MSGSLGRSFQRKEVGMEEGIECEPGISFPHESDNKMHFS